VHRVCGPRGPLPGSTTFSNFDGPDVISEKLGPAYKKV
jgi:hypothetical protein